MRTVAVTNTDRGVLVGDKIGLANRWWTRFRGLLGRSALAAGEGLLLVPCRGGHTFGKRRSLVLAFRDTEGIVTALYHRNEPGARTPIHREAWGVLELPAGVLAETGTAIGDRLEWERTVVRTKESVQ
jgi:uncharacterized membrane protein (UPF0127 family)